MHITQHFARKELIDDNAKVATKNISALTHVTSSTLVLHVVGAISKSNQRPCNALCFMLIVDPQNAMNDNEYMVHL